MMYDETSRQWRCEWMNVNKCSRGTLEVLGVIQNDVKIGQVYIILDDLSHKWKKRYRPKENLPPGDQDPVIWRVAGTCDCVDQKRPVSRAGPGRVFQTPAAGQTDPCRSRRVAARARTQSSSVFPGGCALAGLLAASRQENLPFLQSPQARNKLVKSVLCTCHEISVAWRMVFVFLPLKLLLPCGARIDWSLFLFLICWPTHSLRADFFPDRNLETPYVIVIAGSPGFARWEKRNLFGCQTKIG